MMNIKKPLITRIVGNGFKPFPTLIVIVFLFVETGYSANGPSQLRPALQFSDMAKEAIKRASEPGAMDKRKAADSGETGLSPVKTQDFSSFVKTISANPTQQSEEFTVLDIGTGKKAEFCFKINSLLSQSNIPAHVCGIEPSNVESEAIDLETYALGNRNGITFEHVSLENFTAKKSVIATHMKFNMIFITAPYFYINEQMLRNIHAALKENGVLIITYLAEDYGKWNNGGNQIDMIKHNFKVEVEKKVLTGFPGSSIFSKLSPSIIIKFAKNSPFSQAAQASPVAASSSAGETAERKAAESRIAGLPQGRVEGVMKENPAMEPQEMAFSEILPSQWQIAPNAAIICSTLYSDLEIYYQKIITATEELIELMKSGKTFELAKFKALRSEVSIMLPTMLEKLPRTDEYRSSGTIGHSASRSAVYFGLHLDSVELFLEGKFSNIPNKREQIIDELTRTKKLIETQFEMVEWRAGITPAALSGPSGAAEGKSINSPAYIEASRNCL